MSQSYNEHFPHERRLLESRAEIHIHVISPKLVDYLTSDYLLDKREIDRSNKLIFNKDRNLYKASHVFLRRILSRYSDVDPEHWGFSYNNFGKPAIKNHGQENLNFNLSHTHSMIACAVGYQYDLGIDIESNVTLNDLEDMCHLVLCDNERGNVLSAPPSQQEKTFYRYWTLKEAYVKALGKGLTIPLKNIKYESTTVSSWLSSVDLKPKIEGNLYGWYHDLAEPYSLALCAKIDEPNYTPIIRLLDWNNNTSECFNFNVKPKY